ncbi:MAG: hypothetical protein ACFCUG_10790 [Thiotrichales bacterium]
MTRKHDPLSSRELLERIGLADPSASDWLNDESLEGVSGDMGEALRARYRLFAQSHCFVPGDLVTWKPGLRNRRLPRYGGPAIVLAVLDSPVFDAGVDSGQTYFREPLDLVLGVLWDHGSNQGELLSWHFDSRRFQPWREEAGV